MRTDGAQGGFTLIELAISMSIISIVVVGTLTTMNAMTARSMDPIIQHQTSALAQAYLQEVLLRPYFDPDDDPGMTDPFCCMTEGNRTLFDNVADFHDLMDATPVDQNGNDLAATYMSLGAYGVTIDVMSVTSWGPTGMELMNPALRVAVAVTHNPSGYVDRLIGYRTSY